MGSLKSMIKYALRRLARDRGYAAIVILTLALGIGANTAIFSIVSAVLLKPLLFPEPDRIVRILESSPRMSLGRTSSQARRSGFSLDSFREWRDANSVFSAMAAYHGVSFTLTGGTDPVSITGLGTSSGLFEVLGVPPILGRTLQLQDEEPGNNRVIVLSHAAWMKYLGGDAKAVGRIVQLDGQDYSVLGVMPEGFEFPDPATEFWVPLVIGPRPKREDTERRVLVLPVVARLKPDVSIAAAEGEGHSVVQALRREIPDLQPDMKESKLSLSSFQEELTAPVRTPLLILWIAVAALLLVACLNIANLQLSRALDRQRDVAVRAALGASRRRLIGQELSESCLLAVSGGTAGIFIANWGLNLLLSIRGAEIPSAHKISIDGSVLLFTLGLSLLTGFLSGIFPSLRTTKVDLTSALKEGAEQARGLSIGHGRLRNVLVSAQIALALTLLIAGGLLINSFLRLASVDPGFATDSVLAMNINLPRYRYSSTESRRSFYDRLLEGARGIPGIREAGFTNLLPLTQMNIELTFQIEGRPEPSSPEDTPRASLRVVSPGFFEAMGIRKLEGRFFVLQDTNPSNGALIVNQALAQRYFPDENPVGKRIMPFGEIVGVVDNVLHASLDAEPRPEFFVNLAQAPAPMGELLNRGALVVRGDISNPSMITGLRELVQTIDDGLPPFETQLMSDRVLQSIAAPRLYAWLMGIFGVLALFLAAVGLYGSVSYSVTRRAHETGIRMALGANRANIVGMVVRQGFVALAAGLAVGFLLSLAATRALEGLLFGITVSDPATVAGVIALLTAVALVATYLPARRASRQDPISALRSL